jgi:hypothetical protein
MRGPRQSSKVDPEVLRIVHGGLQDESLPAQDGTVWCYRVGSVLIGMRHEDAPMPEIVFWHDFGSASDAVEAMTHLREAAQRNREAAEKISSETERNRSESVELSVAEALNSV